MDFLTPAQCRAARGLLDWSQPDLATRSGVHVQTISGFEQQTSTPTQSTLNKIVRALEAEGIEFGKNETVGRAYQKIITFNGSEGYAQFYNDMYKEMEKTKEKIVYVNYVDERNFADQDKNNFFPKHVKKIKSLNVHYQIIVKEGDTFFPAASYAEYRWIPEQDFSNMSIYIYGSKVAFIIFNKNETRVHLLHEPEITKLHKMQFQKMWEHALLPSQKSKKN